MHHIHLENAFTHKVEASATIWLHAMTLGRIHEECKTDARTDGRIHTSSLLYPKVSSTRNFVTFPLKNSFPKNHSAPEYMEVYATCYVD